MTTIIAFKTKSGVFIGADTQLTSGNTRMPINFSKILRKDNLLIGPAGSLGVMQNILDIAFEAIHKSKLEKYSNKCDLLITPEELANSISHSIFGFLIDGAEFEPADYIICGNGKIILAGYTGSIMEIDQFISEGSGSPFALSILRKDYRKNLTDKASLKLICLALESANYYDIYTNNSFEIYKIDNSGQIIKYPQEETNKKAKSSSL